MANIKNFLNKLRSETGAVSFKDSRYGEVSNYIDTGSYALNRIISGSIHGGFPSGRVIIIAGNSETGKSRIAATCMASALKAGYDHVFYFDSEGGALRQFFESAGCDPDMIDQILVESVEDAQLKILQVYNMILEFKEKEPNAKFLCVLDSLGGLVAEKVLRDADKGKVASEMGGRAKLCLAENTLVKLANGTYKEIKDIKVGDEVITHLSRVRKVTDSWKSSHTKYIKIKVKGEEIKMSLNHKMLVSRNGELQYIEAKDILKTDKLIKIK